MCRVHRSELTVAETRPPEEHSEKMGHSPKPNSSGAERGREATAWFQLWEQRKGQEGRGQGARLAKGLMAVAK